MMDSHQQPNRHRQRDSRKKQIVSQPNHRRSMKNQTPNQDWQILGLVVDAHQPRSFRFPKRKLGKSKPVFGSSPVAWFDTWRWLHYVEDRDKVICHTCTRAHITQQLATLMLNAGMQNRNCDFWLRDACQ